MHADWVTHVCAALPKVVTWWIRDVADSDMVHMETKLEQQLMWQFYCIVARSPDVHVDIWCLTRGQVWRCVGTVAQWSHQPLTSVLVRQSCCDCSYINHAIHLLMHSQHLTSFTSRKHALADYPLYVFRYVGTRPFGSTETQLTCFEVIWWKLN